MKDSICHKQKKQANGRWRAKTIVTCVEKLWSNAITNGTKLIMKIQYMTMEPSHGETKRKKQHERDPSIPTMHPLKLRTILPVALLGTKNMSMNWWGF